METDPNAIAMSNLSNRIGAQALFGTNICHRRARGPRVLRGLSLLIGLLVTHSAITGTVDKEYELDGESHRCAIPRPLNITWNPAGPVRWPLP